MLLPLALLVVALAALLLLWAVWFIVKDRAVILKQLWGASVVEAVLVVQIVVAGVLVARGADVADPVSLWGYLVTVLLILPFAALWAFAERTRWSSVVLAIAALTVMFLEYRLLQIWGA